MEHLWRRPFLNARVGDGVPCALTIGFPLLWIFSVIKLPFYSSPKARGAPWLNNSFSFITLHCLSEMVCRWENLLLRKTITATQCSNDVCL
jgi:hypothetical protein